MLTCFIFSKSDSSAPPASLLLPAGFALRGDRRTNGKHFSAAAIGTVHVAAATGQLTIKLLAVAA